MTMSAVSMLLKTLARQGETFTKRSLTDALIMKKMPDAPKWVHIFIQDAIEEGLIHPMGGGIYMVNGTHKVHNPGRRRTSSSRPVRTILKRARIDGGIMITNNELGRVLSKHNVTRIDTAPYMLHLSFGKYYVSRSGDKKYPWMVSHWM